MLLTSAVAGDAAAYARFLKVITGPIRTFARNALARSGLAADAEDVVQEVLLAIHLKRHTWERTAPARPWVYAIARHKMIDLLRRRGRRAEVDIADFSEVLAADDAPDRLSEREIDRALSSLPDGQRKVVTAVSVDGKSIRAAAESFGMTEGAVRVALHRGLAALAERFGGKVGP